MDTQYRKNLKAVAQACKDYTDNSIEKLKWELGTYDLSVTTDSTVAYTKTIPTNTIKGRLNYIGGASKVSENLIVLNDVAETTTNGVTYKVENGVLYVKGTATANATILFSYIDLSSGSYYFSIGNNDTLSSMYFVLLPNGSWSDVTENEKVYSSGTKTLNGNYRLGFAISNGKTIGDSYYQLKPMLVKGTTAPTEWKQGFENIRSAKTTSVKFEGANVLNPDNTFTYSTYTDLAYFECVGGATYTLKSFGSYTGSFGIFKYDGNSWSSIEAHTLNSGYTITAPSDAIRIGVNGVVSQSVMAVRGSVAPTTYQPYIAPITKAIPSEIINNEYYGLGYDDTHYNKLDLITKNIYADWKLITLNGSENWYKNEPWSSENNVSMYVGYNNQAVTNSSALMNYSFNNAGSSAVNSTTTDQYRLTNVVYLNFTAGGGKISEFTVAKAKEWLSNNPLTILYNMATQVVVDVSQYIGDEFKNIDTTNMTTATFENEFGYDVPSEIDYLIEEVKA